MNTTPPATRGWRPLDLSGYRAIQEANERWQQIDPRVNVTRETRLQLANRLAFTWKLGMVGIPTVLVYLGFTRDDGIRDVGTSYPDGTDWARAFGECAEGRFSAELWGKRADLGPAPVWVVVEGREVLNLSPRPGTTGRGSFFLAASRQSHTPSAPR